MKSGRVCTIASWLILVIVDYTSIGSLEWLLHRSGRTRDLEGQATRPRSRPRPYQPIVINAMGASVPWASERLAESIGKGLEIAGSKLTNLKAAEVSVAFWAAEQISQASSGSCSFGLEQRILLDVPLVQ
jgi:hypothetical protein